MTIHFHDNSSIATAIGLGQNAGDILQTVGIVRLASSFTTTSTSVADSGLSASITPSSTSSKVLVIAQLDLLGYGDRDRRPHTGLYYTNFSSSNRLAHAMAGEYHTGDSGSYSYGQHSYFYIHLPSTTSQVTYRIGLRSGDGSNVRIYGGSGSDTRSYMYLQEIKG